MYLFFVIENFYPNGGFGDLKFVFDNKKELKEKIDTELNAFEIRSNNNGESIKYCENFDQTDFAIWKLESLESLKDMKDFYRDELDEFLVYLEALHDTVWENLSPKSEKNIDKLNQMLYNDIVNKLGLI